MKKIAVLLVLLCLIACSLFADDFTSCLTLIDKKLDASTVASIQQFSANLSDSQKYSLYESKKTSGTVPFVVNLLLGCGIGSYIQGDTLGGTISLCADLGGYGLIIGGMTTAATGIVKNSESSATAGTTAIIAGSIMLVANKIFTCIRPFTYASGYNARLSSALYASPTFAALPAVTESGDVGVVLMAKIDF